MNWKIPFKNIFTYFKLTSSPLTDDEVFNAKFFMFVNLN